MEGNRRVEELMMPVNEAIKRHVKYPSDGFTDIYNQAYVAVMKALEETERSPTISGCQCSTCLGMMDFRQHLFARLAREGAQHE